jgi:hypothetical protein
MSRSNRINKHIVNLGIRDYKLAARAETRVIRFGRRATAQLIDACNDTNPQVRLRAAWSLGLIADPRAYETLARLCNDPSDEVTYDARIALGLSGDPRALDVLVALIDDPNDDRNSAPMGIQRMNLPLSKLQEFVSSANPKHRSLGLYLLLSNSDPGALDLAKKLLTDKDPTVKAEAADVVACLETGGWTRIRNAQHRKRVLPA